MSDYGNPPRDPSQPDPYGQPGPYGQQPGYGQASYGAPATGYAHWIKRVGAYLIDGLLGSLIGFPLWIGYGILAANTTTSRNPDGTVSSSTQASPVALTLIVLGVVLSLGFLIWNSFLRQGRTGYSIGKGALGIRLLGLSSGQPIGAGMAFLRYLAHVLDALPCYLGYLWPLWDKKRQTFADKVCSTVVVDQPPR